MENIVDVLIVGSGVSGLYCALNLDEKLNVLVVSKSNLKNTNTYLAQGGISTARNNNDIELFIEDSYDTCKELTHELLSYEYIFRGEGNGSVLLS